MWSYRRTVLGRVEGLIFLGENEGKSRKLAKNKLFFGYWFDSTYGMGSKKG
jgi:hypothetical protein